MVTLILAQDEDGGIGKGNDLPWPRIKEDMKFFKDTTMGNSCIMGRKTFASMKAKPLPGRINIVLSTSHPSADAEIDYGTSDGDKFTKDMTWMVKTYSLEEAFRIIEKIGNDGQEIFVIGGAEIYNLALPYADRVLLTRVVGKYDADVFFKFDTDGWVLEESKEAKKGDKLICTFETYQRAPNNEKRTL